MIIVPDTPSNRCSYSPVRIDSKFFEDSPSKYSGSCQNRNIEAVVDRSDSAGKRDGIVFVYLSYSQNPKKYKEGNIGTNYQSNSLKNGTHYSIPIHIDQPYLSGQSALFFLITFQEGLKQNIGDLGTSAKNICFQNSDLSINDRI